MTLKDKFLNLFRKDSWKTVWTHKAEGYITNELGERIRFTKNLLIVIQVDNRKNKYRSYMTNGTLDTDIDINFLVSEYPALKNILTENGITI